MRWRRSQASPYFQHIFEKEVRYICKTSENKNNFLGIYL